MTEANVQRWCRRGDTISTVRPMIEHDGRAPNQHLHATCPTPESCAEANELIAAGRWRVSRCGQCEKTVETCQCEWSNGWVVTTPATRVEYEDGTIITHNEVRVVGKQIDT